MEFETVISGDSQEKFNCIQERLKATREKMEVETLAFIEATKLFVSEWIQREIKMAAISPESGAFSGDLRFEDRKAGESNLDLKEMFLKISDTVETYLNRGDYWIHRNSLFQPDISRDYVEFKKKKILRELTSSVRIILGCASEIFWELEDGEPENKGWVKELGRRKYVCFLRFSDEMTASLNRYFALLEELFILNHEINEEKLRKEA